MLRCRKKSQKAALGSEGRLFFCCQPYCRFALPPLRGGARRAGESGVFSEFTSLNATHFCVSPYSVVPPLSPLLLVKVLEATWLATPSLMATAFTVVVALRVKGAV